LDADEDDEEDDAGPSCACHRLPASDPPTVESLVFFLSFLLLAPAALAPAALAPAALAPASKSRALITPAPPPATSAGGLFMLLPLARRRRAAVSASSFCEHIWVKPWKSVIPEGVSIIESMLSTKLNRTSSLGGNSGAAVSGGSIKPRSEAKIAVRPAAVVAEAGSS
jgi:hypothetical protein